MNQNKLPHVATILLLGSLAWFLVDVPDGLRETSILADISQRSGLSIGAAREAVRLLETTGNLQQLPSALELDEHRRSQLRQAIAEASSNENARRVSRRTWRLFVVFFTTILLILFNTMPIFVAALGALSIAILSGLLTPAQGFSGFSNSVIILIVVAFTIALGVAKSGLGKRIAYLMIGRFGGSTLGLGYSLAVTDVLIAPAFPSNTARSGVLFPIVDSVAQGGGSTPFDPSRKRMGSFLIMNSVAGLSISSAMWLTAMSANPLGADLAKEVAGIEISFAKWLMSASVPSLVALILVPFCLHQFFRPQVTQTPEAPAEARRELASMGPMARSEWIMAGVFVVLVILWALSKPLGMNLTAIAMGGLFVLMVTRVVTIDDIRGSNGAITFVWFGALYTLSSYLNTFGFMEWVGQSVTQAIDGYSWPTIYVVLLLAYILIHYFFVSQTAHMLAVFPIFLQVGVAAGVPGHLLAMMLLMATNFFAPLTPQASSANAIFVGSGYLTTGEIYKNGGLVVLLNTLIYGLIGTAWISWSLS